MDSSAKQLPCIEDSYVVGPVIAKGGSCVVRSGIHRETKRKYILKIANLKYMTKSKIPRFYAEIKALQKLDHPNIVRLYEVASYHGRLCLVLEYVSGSELFEVISGHGAISRRSTLKIIRNVARALQHCHDRGVYHRDIKPENILLDKKRKVKLIDFGLCHITESSTPEALTTACGSAIYASPEVVAGKPYNGALADIWSLGVLTFVCITGCAPWSDENASSLHRSITKGVYEIPKEVDADVAHLIRSMMEIDVKKRATLEKVLSHPCFQKLTSQTQQSDPTTTPTRPLVAAIVAEAAASIVAKSHSSPSLLSSAQSPSSSPPSSPLEDLTEQLPLKFFTSAHTSHSVSQRVTEEHKDQQAVKKSPCKLSLRLQQAAEAPGGVSLVSVSAIPEPIRT